MRIAAWTNFRQFCIIILEGGWETGKFRRNLFTSVEPKRLSEKSLGWIWETDFIERTLNLRIRKSIFLIDKTIVLVHPIWNFESDICLHLKRGRINTQNPPAKDQETRAETKVITEALVEILHWTPRNTNRQKFTFD